MPGSRSSSSRHVRMLAGSGAKMAAVLKVYEMLSALERAPISCPLTTVDTDLLVPLRLAHCSYRSPLSLRHSLTSPPTSSTHKELRRCFDSCDVLNGPPAGTPFRAAGQGIKDDSRHKSKYVTDHVVRDVRIDAKCWFQRSYCRNKILVVSRNLESCIWYPTTSRVH